VIWLLVGPLLLVLISGLLIALWVAADERWQARAEEAHLDREVCRAEHRLHRVASNAFGSMLEAARQVPRGESQWPR
jgi:hypothetical protein